jgi:hypothetical protein
VVADRHGRQVGADGDGTLVAAVAEVLFEREGITLPIEWWDQVREHHTGHAGRAAIAPSGTVSAW